MAKNPYADKQRKYLAVLQVRPTPGIERHRVILRETDVRHITDENPNGSICVYETLQFVAYPTPKIKALLSGGKLEDITDKKPGEVNADSIPADFIGSIIDDPLLVKALNDAGISSVEELQDAWVATRCEGLHGIGAARQARIKTILVREGLIVDEPGDSE